MCNVPCIPDTKRYCIPIDMIELLIMIETNFQHFVFRYFVSSSLWIGLIIIGVIMVVIHGPRMLSIIKLTHPDYLRGVNICAFCKVHCSKLYIVILPEINHNHRNTFLNACQVHSSIM